MSATTACLFIWNISSLHLNTQIFHFIKLQSRTLRCRRQTKWSRTFSLIWASQKRTDEHPRCPRLTAMPNANGSCDRIHLVHLYGGTRKPLSTFKRTSDGEKAALKQQQTKEASVTARSGGGGGGGGDRRFWNISVRTRAAQIGNSRYIPLLKWYFEHDQRFASRARLKQRHAHRRPVVSRVAGIISDFWNRCSLKSNLLVRSRSIASSSRLRLRLKRRLLESPLVKPLLKGRTARLAERFKTQTDDKFGPHCWYFTKKETVSAFGLIYAAVMTTSACDVTRYDFSAKSSKTLSGRPKISSIDSKQQYSLCSHSMASYSGSY